MQHLFDTDESILIETKPKFSDIFWYNLILVAWRICLLIILAIIYLNAHHQLYEDTLSGMSLDVEIISLIAIAIILSFVINYFYTYLYTKNADYILTNKKIYLRSGILSIDKKIILYRSVADLNLNQSFLARIFGLGSLRIDEYAGNTTNRHLIKGLKIDQLEHILKLISQNVQSAKNTIS